MDTGQALGFPKRLATSVGFANVDIAHSVVYCYVDVLACYFNRVIKLNNRVSLNLSIHCVPYQACGVRTPAVAVFFGDEFDVLNLLFVFFLV